MIGNSLGAGLSPHVTHEISVERLSYHEAEFIHSTSASQNSGPSASEPKGVPPRTPAGHEVFFQ